ncbi:MAG: family 20 glycosylhydrolase [Lentisphaerota bacterium]
MNLKFNCYHFDIGRGAYLKPEIFKRAMKLAADSGFTHFLPYLENMIKLPSMEKACPKCAYTAEQWCDFDKTAGEYDIELIPHFNVVGHTTQICKVYPELAGEKDGFEMDVTSKVAKDWMLRCLNEYCSFSNGKYFLIGADEWQAPNHLLALDDFNVAKVWADQVNLAVEYLVSQKRIPIVWHDMLMHYPEAMKLLSKDAVIAFWFYDEDSDYAVLDTFKRLGFQVIMASGLCDGLLTARRMKAVESAVESMERHNVDMFMMTSWEDISWEKETVDIPLVGMILKNEKPPMHIIETASFYELIERNPNSVRTPGYVKKISELLKDGAWEKYPEAHAFFENMLSHNYRAVLESFEKYHFSEGPIYDRIKALQDAGTATLPEPSSEKACEVRRKNGIFELIAGKDFQKGEWFRFVNGDESFEVYPRFGGTLQDWRSGDDIIIPESVDARLKRENMFEKGGYRSYASLGGFRPLWALGTHHNPCILWNFPFSWNIIADSPELKTIELSRSFYHVDVTYRISIRKGTTGFSYYLKAVNKLDFTYGAFNFNLPLSLCDSELNSTSLQWEEKNQLQSLSFKDVKNSFFVIPSKRSVHVKKQNYLLTIDCGEVGGSGFYVDWSSTFMTPDLHGSYKPLKKGDVTETQWAFRCER